MKLTLSEIRILMIRLGIALAAYPACKILFYLFNSGYFPGVSSGEFLSILFFGLRFDFAALALMNSAFILLHMIPSGISARPGYQLFLKILFLAGNGAAVLADCVDTEYFRFTMKRTTFDFFDLFGLGNDIPTLLPQYIRDFWHVLVMAGILIWVLAVAYRKTMPLVRKLPADRLSFARASSWLVLNLLVIAIMVIGFRGGIQLRPIMTINASEYTSAQNIPLMVNTPFSIIKSYGLEQLEEKIFFKEREAALYFNPERRGVSTKDSLRTNVFLIILESFSKEYIGSLSHRKTYTPFLDSLTGKSYVFTNAFANGKKSIEGIPAILGGLPSLMNESYITSAYCSNNFDGLPGKLKKLGYHSAFFHGGTKGTMGFDAFCGAAGFDLYFGKETYGNEKDYDGNWGIWDEEFFAYTLNEVSGLPQPFFSTLFTLSSHHPFRVPERYANTFPEGTLPIHKSIQYTDHALRKFFRAASQQPWFKNTIFVLTADHTGPSEDPYYANIQGSFAIPILIYDPSGRLQGRDTQIAQQVDILPTLLNRLGYPDPYFAFGNDLLDSSSARYAVTFTSDVFQIADNTRLLQFDGGKTIGLFDYKRDSLLQQNLLATDSSGMLRLENKLKAILQTYYSGMIHNRLTLRNP